MHPDSLTRQRAYKTELDPNQAQRQAFLRHAGCARFIYNWALRCKQEAYAATGKSPSAFTLNKELTLLKRGECPWLYEVSNSALQYAIRQCDAAYANFFRRVKEGKKGRALGFPRFKSRKRGIGSFKVNGSIHVFADAIQLPSIGRVRLKEKGYLPTSGVRITSATVSERAGRWYVSIQVEEVVATPVHHGGVVGVDLGLSALATLSDGTVIAHPKALKRHERKLTRAQRHLSRCQKGSANRQKAKRRVATIHAHIANVRSHALHEATTAITKRYALIGVESLNVAGMMKNHCLAKSIGDSGWAEFLRQLAYKTEWAGGQLIEAGRFYPSSKTCSGCGAVKAELSLSERTYRCAACGLVVDRDLNAALNLEMLAVKYTESLNASLSPCQTSPGDAVGIDGGTLQPVGCRTSAEVQHGQLALL